MKITEENIEAWLLDYVEGSLDPAQVIKFEAHLKEHPEHQKLIEGFEIITIPKDETVVFPNKEQLLKKPRRKIVALKKWILPLAAAASFLLFFLWQSQSDIAPSDEKTQSITNVGQENEQEKQPVKSNNVEPLTAPEKEVEFLANSADESKNGTTAIAKEENEPGNFAKQKTAKQAATKLASNQEKRSAVAKGKSLKNEFPENSVAEKTSSKQGDNNPTKIIELAPELDQKSTENIAVQEIDTPNKASNEFHEENLLKETETNTELEIAQKDDPKKSKKDIELLTDEGQLKTNEEFAEIIKKDNTTKTEQTFSEEFESSMDTEAAAANELQKGSPKMTEELSLKSTEGKKSTKKRFLKALGDKLERAFLPEAFSENMKSTSDEFKIISKDEK